MKTGNVRAKLTRTSDAVVLQGWVLGENDTSFVFCASNGTEVLPGQAFICEVYGLEWIVTHLAVARVVTVGKCQDEQTCDLTLALDRVQTISVARGAGTERVLVDGFTACLWGSSGKVAGECPIKDVSSRGLGVIVPEVITPESDVTVVVEGGDEPLTLTCTVRYCRPERGAHRIGLAIVSADRLTVAKWTQIVNARRPKQTKAA